MIRSLESSFLFDNPIVGREIRIGLRPGFVALTLSLYGLFLLGGFWAAYLFYRVYANFMVEVIDFGAVCFLLLMGVQVALCTIFVPFRACGFLDRERKDRSLDQFLVSGYSPYSALLGKLGISFLFSLILISIGLPFAILCHQAGGVPAGTIVRAYVVLAVYNLFLLNFSIALSTQIPDISAAVVTGVGVLFMITLAHLEFTPPALRALSPLQHLLADFEEPIARTGLIIEETTFFALPIEPWVLSIFYYLSLSVLSAFVAVMGPEIPIITGLHVYGETRTPAGRKRRKTRSLFARSSELAFLYENRPEWLRRNDIPFREGVIGLFLLLLFVTLMGTLWPPLAAPFDVDTFLYPLCLFTFILLPLLALTGLRGQRAFSRTVSLGRWRVSAMTVSRLAFVLKALVPLGCAAAAVTLTDRVHLGDGFERYVWAFVVVFAFSLFLFSVFLTISIFTQSPLRAVSIGLLVGGGVTVLPLFWFTGYYNFWWGPDTHFVAELSPLLAVLGALMPDQSIPATRFLEGAGIPGGIRESIEIYPDPKVFLLLYVPLALGVLFAGDRWIRRRLRALAAAGVVVAVLLGGAGEALAQAEESPIKLEVEVGFDEDIAGNWMPVTIKVTNNGPDVEGRLRISLTGTQRGSWAFPIVIPEGGEKRIQKVLTTPLDVHSVMMGGAWTWSPTGPVPLVSFSSGLGEIHVSLEEGGLTIAEADPITPGMRGALRWMTSQGFWFGGPDIVFEPPVLTIDSRGPLSIQKEEDAAYSPWSEEWQLRSEIWALPDVPDGYEGVGAILLGDLVPGRLSASQQRAIRIWVERGGTLIVSPHRISGSWTGSFLAEMTGLSGLVFEKERDLSGLATRYRSPFEKERPAALTADLSAIDGDVLLGGEEGPLVVRIPVGSGRVVFMGFDPWAPPIPGWKGGRRMIFDLAGESAGDPSESFRQVFLRAAGAPRGGIGPTLLFGLIFLVTVGPVTYVFLRWRKSPRAIWLAAPAVSILFAVAAAIVSPLDRGEPSACLDATVLDLHPGSQVGVASRYLVYLSSGRERHALTVRGEEPGLQLMQMHPVGYLARQIVPSTAGADEVTLDPLRIHRWGSRLAHLRADFRLDGPVTARCVKGKGRIEIAVENGSGIDLREVFLRVGYYRDIFHTGYVTVGDLPAGSRYEKTIALDGTEGKVIRQGFVIPSGRLTPEVEEFLTSATAVGIKGEVLVALLSPEVGDGILEPEFDGGTDRKRLPSLLCLPIEVATPPSGKFIMADLPHRRLPFEMVEVGGGGPPPMPVAGGMAWVGGGSGTASVPARPWEFRVPSQAVGASIDGLTIELPSGTTVPLYQIYDWIDGAWVDLTAAPPATPAPAAAAGPVLSPERSIDLEDPARYLLRPEGVILVREIDTRGQSWAWGGGGFAEPRVILEGTK